MSAFNPGVGSIEAGGRGLLGVTTSPAGVDNPNYAPELTGQNATSSAPKELQGM